MGVPKFYRWVSERYPCLSETVKEYQIPEFDNLYLDMNGIIHVCSHPEDDNPHFRITEEKIFKDIFHYLEFLFRMIKPRKVFFMAIDGVAPRAKMNQQRGRRFRSAREAEALERKARESGETLPTEKRFDSNCITPGTEFMVKLHEQLKYFVTSKISSDPLWHGVDVYLSGHETPGEGEHKVMDFIRCQKSKPDYDSNTRHCLYGLDADLMMLGLATHEPHFSLLREEVRFGGKKDRNKRPATPEETTFHLLHLSLFREYLDFEFSSLKDKLPFGYSLENIIDDWILMGFLVGNDFIPHLPHLHIHHDALPLLWKTYMTILPECGGYMNEGGHLNLERFDRYMKELAKFDLDKFSEVFTDLKWFEGKKAERSEKEQMEGNSRKKKKDNLNQFLLLESLDNNEEEGQLSENQEKAQLDEDTEDLAEEEDEDSDTFDEEFRLHKRNYYMTKLEYENVDKQVLRDQCEEYVRAIQWILLYYFEGVPSWSWFYPHHYAPFISDVTDFKDMDIKFEMGSPFLPFQQLMAVLPAASKELLPEPYQKLMTQDISPVIDFYPVDFQTDLNGKQQEWEAVVLIPFIDEARLLEAMKLVENQLSPSEKKRNAHGPCLLYDYTPSMLEPCTSTLPGVFSDIINNHARLRELGVDAFRVDPDKMVKGLMPQVRLDVYFPGFPTLKHILHKAFLKKEGVKVFQMNSRNENMMLEILEDPDKPVDIEAVAERLLGNTTYVGWPHLFEAKVVQVSNDTDRYVLVETPQKGGKGPKVKEIMKEVLNNSESNVWQKEVSSIKERYHDRLGVAIGNTSVLIKALPMNGRTFVCGSHGAITLQKQFSQNPVPFVYQATVKDISVHDPSFCQYKTLSELFPVGEVAFMLGWPHYGCQGEVVDVEEGESPRVRINVTTLEEPNLSKFNDTERYNQQYYTSFQAAQWLGIGSHFLSRITGCIFIKPGSRTNPKDAHMVNIGLNLKFTKKCEEVPGYTRLTPDGWLYSQKASDTVLEYLEKFPELWDIVANMDREKNDVIYEEDIFKNLRETMENVVEYVKSLPCSQIKPQKVGANVLDEGVVQAIQKEAQTVNERNKKKMNVKKVKMQVKPYLLYKPLIIQGGVVPDPTVQYEMFDRVVNVRTGYSVPFGLRGTVVGIQKGEKDADAIYDIIFDEEFSGGIVIRGSSERGYRLQSAAMINITHGCRKNGAAKDPRSQPTQEQERGGQFQNSKNYSGGQYQQRQQSYPSGNQSRGFNSYANASRGSQGSYSSLKNRNDNSRNLDYEYPDREWGYNNPGKGQRNSQWARGYSGDYQANMDYDGYNDRGHHTDGSWRRGEHNNGDSWRRGQNGSRDVRQQQKEENRRENQIKSQQNKSQSKDREVDLRQQSFDGSDSVKPTFVTPKVTQQAKKDDSSRKSIPDGQSEFANMWKELQSSSTSSKPKEMTKPITLDQAAAALDKVPSPQAPQVAIDQKPPSTTLEQLFIQAKSAQEQTAKEKSPNAEDTAAALKQMLKIGSDQENTNSPSKPNTNKDFMRQLSVQELFDGAKQLPPTTQLAPGQSPLEQDRQRQRAPDHQDQGQRNQPPQPLQGNRRNPVQDLAAWCRSFGKPEPRYDFVGQPGAYSCIVTLTPDGARFQGSQMRNKQDAIENAAAITLLQIGGQQMNAQMGLPGMRQLASPNSAFKPVPQMLPPYNMGPNMRFPRHHGPPMQQFYVPPQYRNFRPPPAYYNGPNKQTPANYYGPNNPNQQGQWRPQSGGYNSKHGDRAANPEDRKSDLDPHCNPFVPLQVTRQQKTPNKRKESDPGQETSERTGSERVENKRESGSQENTPAWSKKRDSNQAANQVGSDAKSVTKGTANQRNSEKSPHKAQGGHNKRRSRIAANLNFGAS